MHATGLAILHHLLVFGMVIMLAMEPAYLRSPRIDAARLTRVDAGYGVAAVLVLFVGVARVVWGDKGWVFYQDNPFFWAKMATLTAIALLSIPPTLAFFRWNKAAKADPTAQPDAAAVGTVARLVRIEILLLFPLVAFAATMARWTG